MPYQWLPPEGRTARLHLWPHRSLGARGFVWFIGITAALIALPLIALLGTPAVWMLLPFVGGAVAAIWVALRRNARDGQVREVLTLTFDSIHLTRSSPRGTTQDWTANPHWVRVTLIATGGPVPNYLTLTGNNREVELGAFLSEEERIALAADLKSRLAALR